MGMLFFLFESSCWFLYLLIRDTNIADLQAATVILTNNYLESPFGQPLPLATGTIISAIIGTGLTKLFMLNPANEEYLWVCGVLAVAISSVIMGLTGTLHPAAASTALLCATSKEIREQLGWFYLVNQIVISIITIGIACLFGNMYSRYPLYWLLPPRLETPKSHRLFAPWLGSIFGCLFHQEKVESSSSSDISGSSESKDSTDLSSFSSEGSNERGQYDEDLPVRDYGDYGDYTHTDYDEDDNTESGEEYTPAPAKPTN